MAESSSAADPTGGMEIPAETFLVTEVNSLEYELLRRSLACSSIVGFDAEWKPLSRRNDRVEARSDESDESRSFPTVTLFQIACREAPGTAGEAVAGGGTRVFLVDLLALQLGELWGTLRDVFESPCVLKLGFRFKQDLIYLSSTFAAKGCHGGFDKVEPFIDITSVHHYLKTGSKGDGNFFPKQSASLATICKQVLGVDLSKELQCSDWSVRPLTAEQTLYAAADAYYLLEIFDVFQRTFNDQGESCASCVKVYSHRSSGGLKDIFLGPDFCENISGIKYGKAISMFTGSRESTLPLDISLSKIIEKYGNRIILQESDRKPRTSRRKGRKQPSSSWQSKDLQPLPPLDSSGGADEQPRFLCDVMVEGLAKYLRCVGIDAAIPSAKKPQPRQLIEQACKEKRVILTRDAKLLQYQYLTGNYVYRVKSLIKNDQLLEVIETFKLKISEEQLMSRCTKCNGQFIQKPLTVEEAVAASKGFQVIPSCLFDRGLEFWQCVDCGQLYWEGTQYQNAVQRFIDVCKLTA